MKIEKVNFFLMKKKITKNIKEEFNSSVVASPSSETSEYRVTVCLGPSYWIRHLDLLNFVFRFVISSIENRPVPIFIRIKQIYTYISL